MQLWTAVRPSLNQLRFLLESFPVRTNNADFFTVESREFYRLTEESIFFLLVVCRERVLMNDHEIFIFAAGLSEIGQ